MKFNIGDIIIHENEESEVVGFIEEGHLTRYLCRYTKPFDFKHCYGTDHYEAGAEWSQFTETVDKYYELRDK